jgi:hypothetical protein
MKNTALQRISIDVFPEKELSGLSSDFHIDVSVSGLHILSSRIGRSIVGKYKSLTET